MTLSHSNLHKTTLTMHIENEYILTKLKGKQLKFYLLKSNFSIILFQTRIPKKVEGSMDETGSPMSCGSGTVTKGIRNLWSATYINDSFWGTG